MRYLALEDEIDGFDAMRKAVSELGFMYRTSVATSEPAGSACLRLPFRFTFMVETIINFAP